MTVTVVVGTALDGVASGAGAEGTTVVDMTALDGVASGAG